jgi:ATP-dependent protease Clp ATPase subunit
MKNYKSNKVLLEEYHKYVIGHTSCKKSVINLLNRIQIRYHQKFISNESDHDLLSPGSLLLIGPSGTGKTLLVDSAKRLVQFPCFKIDATKLNPAGAGDGGIKVLDLITQIEKMADNLAKTHPCYHSSEGALMQTVLVIDEFDKLAGPHTDNSWYRKVQGGLLTLFDKVNELGGISIILLGAFTGMVDKFTKTKTNIGFTNNTSSETKVCYDTMLLDWGIIPELVGRIRDIACLDTFKKEDYKKILVDTLIPKKLDELAHFNRVDLPMTDDWMEDVVDRAMKSGQGIRYMQRELDKYTLDMEFYYEDTECNSQKLVKLIDRYENQSNFLGDL